MSPSETRHHLIETHAVAGIADIVRFNSMGLTTVLLLKCWCRERVRDRLAPAVSGNGIRSAADGQQLIGRR
ncbi:unnamed protein product [Soboliphyme baturini]|uniref:Death domain-containing protein n=1 Tax=Soboliphyme baturini TaxID=241478 RepID=A0A183IEF8_9BILA|nr:unnamed protein product [Soboliphyme baturini]